MEFLNKRIQSEKYGVGTVISIDDSVFTVEFENETKSFNYMIAFENKALSFIDENDQKELDELFAEKEAERLAAEKKAAEIKEQREREEAQKQEIKDRLSFAVDESLSGDSVKLIGDFEFNDEDLDYLTIHFINQYKYFNESVSKLNEADVKAFLVVMINKLRDYDKPWSEFHELLSSFFDHISLFDTQSKITNLYNKVEKIFETNNRVLFRTDSGKRAFEQTFLYQALAPKDSIQNFIRLAWSLYLDEDILDSVYTESDPDLCLKVIEALNSKFAGQNKEDDSIQFSGASYGIRAGLRYGCEQNKEKTAGLLDRIFDYIHRVDHYSEEITDNYLGTVVTDVITNLKQVVVKERKNGERQYTSGYFHSFEQAKPTLYLNLDQQENPRVFLCYPKVMILNSEDNLQYAMVELYKHFDDGRPAQKFYTHPIQAIKKNDTCQTLRAFTIDITDKIINFKDDFKIEAVLVVRNRYGFERYSSGSSLYRDFLVFKDNHEIKGTSRPGTYCLIGPKNFIPQDNLRLFDKNYRKVLNGIYYFTSKELDLIEYNNTKLLFGSNSRSANVLFVEDKMIESENIFYLPDPENKDNCIPVFKGFSDIFIENENAVSSSSVRITHLTEDSEDGSIIEDKKTLNELGTVDRRYIYPADDNGLLEAGWHSLEIVKLTASGAKSMLNSPKFDYFYDENAKVMCRDIAYIKNQVELVLTILGEKYSVPVSCAQQEVYVDTDSGFFKVIPPYFRWKFGQDNEFRNKPVETPIFLDDVPSSSVLVIDSNIQIDGVYFIPENESKEYPVDKSNVQENTYLLSQFLASNRKKGKFVAKTRDYSVLPILKIEIAPYFKESNMELEFDEGILTCDFSKAFFHDKKDYKLKLIIGTEEFEQPIVLEELNCDSINEVSIDDLDDDNYTIELYYYSEYTGIRSKDIKIMLNNDCFMFGDIVKASFNAREKVVFDKCRTSEGNKKIKDNVIYDIKFAFDEGENRVYEGTLKTPYAKKAKVIFYADEPDVIRKVFFIYGVNSEIRKEANYDLNKNSLVSDEPVDGKIYHMSSIYIKR